MAEEVVLEQQHCNCVNGQGDQGLVNSLGRKADIIRSYGAVAIDRHNENFVEIVRSQTNGRGVDHILDPSVESTQT